LLRVRLFDGILSISPCLFLFPAIFRLNILIEPDFVDGVLIDDVVSAALKRMRLLASATSVSGAH
jgi:hypothetical protein